MTIGKKIYDLRISKGLTQHQLAAALGIGRSNILSWEKGRARPSFNRINVIAKYFQVDINYLMNETPPPLFSDHNLSLIVKVLFSEMAIMISQRDKITIEQAKKGLEDKIQLLKNI